MTMTTLEGYARSHRYWYTTVHAGFNHAGLYLKRCAGCLGPLVAGDRVHVFRPRTSRHLAYEPLCEACAGPMLPERLETSATCRD